MKTLPVLSPAAVAAALCLSMIPASEALAQDTPAADGEFAIQRFDAAIGAENFLTVQRVRMSTQLGWTAGLMFNYSRDPFVLVSCRAETNCDEPNAQNTQNVHVVQNQFQFDLMGSINPLDRLQVGLKVPLSYVDGQGIDATTGQPDADGLSGFGIGDPQVDGKIRFFGDPSSTVALGAGLTVGIPAGHYATPGLYLGNASPGVSVTWRGIVDIKAGGFGVAANIIGSYRGEGTLGTTTVGPMEFRYSVGVGYRFSPIFRIMAEGFGSTQFSSIQGTNTLEVDGAVEFMPLRHGLYLTAGGGAGIIEGVGVPLARGIFGIGWSADSGDADGDGVPDTKDQCPTKKEDKDGFKDDDGCPEDDNDNDGIPDATDQCKDKAETTNGYKDDDGCPDEVKDTDTDGIPDMDDKCPDKAGKVRTKEFYGCADTDEDGLPDPIDKCIEEKEDTDNWEDTDGCPDPDNDGDGVPDIEDECGDKKGTKELHGCPDPDTDGDNIPDSRDKCKEKPENYNGVQDDDGCPEAGQTLVEVTEKDIKILDRVEFETGSDKIKGAGSFKVLDAVAAVLKNYTNIEIVEVGGHTDNVGDANSNKLLSQKRADAVVKYLTGKGIDQTRLKGVGYGQEKPIDDNATTAGKQKNRRVEFAILKPAPQGK